MKSNEKYPALKSLLKIYNIMGYAIIVITVLVSIYLFTGVDDSPLANNRDVYNSMALTLLCGFFSTLLAFTSAEGIQLFMDIEKNTCK